MMKKFYRDNLDGVVFYYEDFGRIDIYYISVSTSYPKEIKLRGYNFNFESTNFTVEDCLSILNSRDSSWKYISNLDIIDKVPFLKELIFSNELDNVLIAKEISKKYEEEGVTINV